MSTISRGVLFGALATALAGCGAMQPTPTRPPDGRIAFVIQRTDAEGIYVMNADGSDLTRIQGGSVAGVAWSPDGAQIAFESAGILVMNADGSNVRQVSSAGESPAWSPDGGRIAFVVRPNINLEKSNASPDQATIDLIKWSHIALMNVDGSAVSEITTGPVADDSPAWSPDQQRIVFERLPLGPEVGNCGDGICVVNADGSGLTQLSPLGEDPAWSPDASRITFATSATGQSGIYVMNADGSEQTNLTPMLASSGGIRGIFTSSVWSQDGRRLSFVYGQTGSSMDVFIVNADGSNLVQLTHGAGLISGLSWR